MSRISYEAGTTGKGFGCKPHEAPPEADGAWHCQERHPGYSAGKYLLNNGWRGFDPRKIVPQASSSPAL